MRRTFHELVGKHVIDASGVCIGRVADLRADNVGGQLRVTGLVVGQGHRLARFAAVILMLGGRIPGYYVPWASIAQIGVAIQLNVTARELSPLSTVQKA